ncbi:MAG: hypothetical protein J0L84_05770 [Verrucomicrobia bacterium]|nr:hypothetical protein [Verrucomicrobiota bacterium]
MSTTIPAAGVTGGLSLPVVCRRFWWPVYGACRDAGLTPAASAVRTRQVLDRLTRGSPFLRHEDHDGRLRLLIRAELEAVGSQGTPEPQFPAPSDGLDLDRAEARDTYGIGMPAEWRFRERWALVVMELALEALCERAAADDRLAQVRRLVPFLERDVPDWRQTDIGEAVDSVEVSNLRDAYRTEVRRVVGTTVTTPMALEAELVELFG